MSQKITGLRVSCPPRGGQESMDQEALGSWGGGGIWSLWCGKLLRKKTGIQPVLRSSPGTVWLLSLKIDLWELDAHRMCTLLVVLRGELNVWEETPEHLLPMAQCDGKNDSLSQVAGFLDDLTVFLCPAWCGVVSEFLGTREEHRRSKSRSMDGNVGWEAVSLLPGCLLPSVAWCQGQASQRCRCG